MATRRSDIIIPEIFTGYVEEQTTNQDSFCSSVLLLLSQP